ncbi:hypothetical protein GCM10008094_15160 [Aidingimonas halophila]|nr:hypothetical protein GCM10008094_15160 [Aidingimonas halophila]
MCSRLPTVERGAHSIKPVASMNMDVPSTPAGMIMLSPGMRVPVKPATHWRLDAWPKRIEKASWDCRST